MEKNELVSIIPNFANNVKSSCLKTMLDCLMDSSIDKIAITDNKFKVIKSNFTYTSCGENIVKKFKLKNISLNEKIKRTIYVAGDKRFFEIRISKIKTENMKYEKFIFIFNDITEEEKYKKRFAKLTNFLRHELSTPLISQTLALKLVLKSDEHKSLIPEILHSNETSYRILKNCLDEVDLEDKEIKLKKNEIELKSFVENVLEDSSNFLSAKNMTIETNIIKPKKFFGDEDLLKKSIENILFQINERCSENSKIIFKAEFSQNNLRFEILAPFKIEEDLFKKNDKKYYTKLAHNNGLNVAEKIIFAHGGRILNQKRCDRTSLKIILPNK